MGDVMNVRTKLIGILSAAASDSHSLTTRIETEKLVDYLIEAGVTVLPEGAIILTREEIAALNDYQKKLDGGGVDLEKE